MTNELMCKACKESLDDHNSCMRKACDYQLGAKERYAEWTFLGGGLGTFE